MKEPIWLSEESAQEYRIRVEEYNKAEERKDTHISVSIGVLIGIFIGSLTTWLLIG